MEFFSKHKIITGILALLLAEESSPHSSVTIQPPLSNRPLRRNRSQQQKKGRPLPLTSRKSRKRKRTRLRKLRQRRTYPSIAFLPTADHLMSP